MSRTHKYSGTYKGERPRLYNTWINMNRRCHNPGFVDYSRYGGRGVTVCDEWRHDFQTFLSWAESHGWAEGLTLDRIDNDGDYCPENCRWATIEEQSNNKRNCTYIEWDGRVQTMAQWAREIGLSYTSVCERFRNGWSVEEALTIPKSGRRKKV